MRDISIVCPNNKKKDFFEKLKKAYMTINGKFTLYSIYFFLYTLFYQMYYTLYRECLNKTKN